MKFFDLGQSGQAQILTAAVMSAVVISGALSTLHYSNQTRLLETGATQRSEMRTALDLAIKHAAFLYHGESGCDPVSLDDKLARLCKDGRVNSATAPYTCSSEGAPYTTRQLQLTVNNRVYNVALSAVSRLQWLQTAGTQDHTLWNDSNGVLQYNRGQTQDAMIEAFTVIGGQKHGVPGQRVIQYAILMNDCTFPNSAENETSISYHQIDKIAQLPTEGTSVTGPNASAWNKTCMGGRYLGDLKGSATVCAASGSVTRADLTILRNYLRSGETTGTVDPADCTKTSNSVFIGSGGIRGCADFNGDGQVNEIDLNILQKVMRGYLYWLPTHY